MVSSSVYRSWFASRFAGANRLDEVRQFSGERANLLQVFHQFTGFGSPSSFSLQKLASLVVVFSNLLCFFYWFIGFGSPSSFALQNSLVECDVPSERRVMGTLQNQLQQ